MRKSRTRPNKTEQDRTRPNEAERGRRKPRKYTNKATGANFKLNEAERDRTRPNEAEWCWSLFTKMTLKDAEMDETEVA